MVRHNLKIEPFHDTATLTVITGEADRDKFMARNDIEPDHITANARGWIMTARPSDGGVHLLVYLPEKRCETTLYHEALHAVLDLLEYHGMPTGANNQELLCYMQEYVVRTIDKAVYTKRRGQRKTSVTK